MHLTASGLAALGCEMHQTPSALGFPTQLPDSILIPITFFDSTQQNVEFALESHCKIGPLQTLVQLKSSDVVRNFNMGT